MKAEEYWLQKYEEQGELVGRRWSDIVKFNAETLESFARIQIEKDRERVKKNAKTMADPYKLHQMPFCPCNIVDPKSIDNTPINLD